MLRDDDVDPDDLRLAAVVLAPDRLPTVTAQAREPYAVLSTSRLLCLACRWYMDILVPSGDAGPDDEDPRLLQRWCLRHGDLDLTDAEVFGCGGFEPRRWCRGRAQLVKRNKRLVSNARRRIMQRTVDNAVARGEYVIDHEQDWSKE
jgi:hypothetical protein